MARIGVVFGCVFVPNIYLLLLLEIKLLRSREYNLHICIHSIYLSYYFISYLIVNVACALVYIKILSFRKSK